MQIASSFLFKKADCKWLSSLNIYKFGWYIGCTLSWRGFWSI